MNQDNKKIVTLSDVNIEKNGCMAVWGYGHNLFLFAKNDQTNVKNTTAIIAPKIHQVTWNRDFNQPIYRKLISESKVIFINIQNFKNEHRSSLSEIQKQLSKYSKEYRSVIKACANENQALQALTDEVDEDAFKNEKYNLEMMEFLWSLFELLFIDTNSNSYILRPLMEWFSQRFYEHDVLAQKVVQSKQKERHPQYWISIKTLLLYGRVEDACKMLMLHSSASSELYRRILKLLQSMPIYNSLVQPYSEFCIKWHQWHDLTTSHLNDAVFSVDTNINDICRIISGDESIFLELKEQLETWYGMFVSRLFYQQPMVTSADLRYHAKYCLDQFTNITQFDNIILSLFSLDVEKAIHLSSAFFNNWWFVSHIVDLLTNLNVIEDKRLNFGSNLREFLLLDYSSSLLSNESLWQTGLDYLSYCPTYGRAYIGEHLLRQDFNSEFKARKLLQLCDLHNFPDCARIIRQELAVKALANNNLAKALVWSAKAKDIQLSNKIVDRIFQEHLKTGELKNLDILNNLGSLMQLSNHIAFLGKFREFEDLYDNGNFSKATDLLLILLNDGNVPKKFWFVLLQSMITLSENNDVSLDKKQICKFMDSLDKYVRWYSLNKVKDINENQEKIQLLRHLLTSHFQMNISNTATN